MKTCSIIDCNGKVISRGWCNVHYRRWIRTGDPLKVAWERGNAAQYDGTDEKLCSKCHDVKSRDDFHSSKSTKDGLFAYCKGCACKVQNGWQKANPERVREIARKKLYGITPEQYTNLMARQCGMCAICQCWLADLPTKQVHVDHNHDTGKVRGILCHSCNVMIGHAKEDVNLLRWAANYMDAHSKM